MRQAVLKTMTSLTVIAVIGSVFVSDASAARRRRSSNSNSQCTAQDAARIRSHSIAHIESKVRAYSVECDRIVNYYLPRIQHALRYGDRRRAQHFYDEAVYRLQRKYHETCSYIHNYGAALWRPSGSPWLPRIRESCAIRGRTGLPSGPQQAGARSRCPAVVVGVELP